MSEEPQVDLSLIARQQQVLTEIRALRDDFAVTTAIAQRMDGTLQGLVNEMRANQEWKIREETCRS